MKRILFLSTLLILFYTVPCFAQDMDVTLQWDANTETDLDGYGVYWDEDSGGPYRNSQDIGLTDDENPDPGFVEYTVKGLEYGTTYYFVVDAFDTENLRSGYSNEVSHNGVAGIPPQDPVINWAKFKLSDGRVITVYHDGKITVTMPNGSLITIEIPEEDPGGDPQ